jgi:RHS repeat-associated protein
LNIYVHGPGSISQIIQNKAYGHSNKDATPEWITTMYYFYDRMGNMLNIHYGSGYSTWEMDAFGNKIPGSNGWPAIDSNGPKEKLTGKLYDEDTGLYYFHARWLDPVGGRFLSRDPQRQGGPGGLYVFTQGNPVNYTDPTGRFWIPFIYCGYFLATHGAWALGCAASCGGDFDIFAGCYWESIKAEPVEAAIGAYAGLVCGSSLAAMICDTHCDFEWHMPHPGKGQPYCHIHIRCWREKEHHEDLFEDGIDLPDHCPWGGRDLKIRLF